MSNCNSEKKLIDYYKRQIHALLISNAEKRNNSDRLEQQLRNAGFKPKIIKIVASKIRRSKRPMSDYSKTSGKLKVS